MTEVWQGPLLQVSVLEVSALTRCLLEELTVLGHLTSIPPPSPCKKKINSILHSPTHNTQFLTSPHVTVVMRGGGMGADCNAI